MTCSHFGIHAYYLRKSWKRQPLLRGASASIRRAAKILLEERITATIHRASKNRCLLRVSKSTIPSARKKLIKAGIRPSLFLSKKEIAYEFCSRCGFEVSGASNYCHRCNNFIGDAHAL